MERRSFLARASVGAGVGAALVAAPAITKAALPAVRWRCSSGFPAALDTVFGSSVETAKRISDTTGGRFQITVAPPGEIVPMPQAADAVAGGTVESAFVFSGWYVGKDPSWAFGGAIPFGLNFRQHNAWWLEGGGEQVFNEWLRQRGMRFVLGGNTGTQMGGWFRREIRTLADVRGLRMRIAGLGGNVWHAAGAVPQQIPGGEIYSALERGTIDAAEFIGPHDDERLGFHRVARFQVAHAFLNLRRDVMEHTASVNRKMQTLRDKNSLNLTQSRKSLAPWGKKRGTFDSFYHSQVGQAGRQALDAHAFEDDIHNFIPALNAAVQHNPIFPNGMLDSHAHPEFLFDDWGGAGWRRGARRRDVASAPAPAPPSP